MNIQASSNHSYTHNPNRPSGPLISNVSAGTPRKQSKMLWLWHTAVQKPAAAALGRWLVHFSDRQKWSGTSRHICTPAKGQQTISENNSFWNPLLQRMCKYIRTQIYLSHYPKLATQLFWHSTEWWHLDIPVVLNKKADNWNVLSSFSWPGDWHIRREHFALVHLQFHILLIKTLLSLIAVDGSLSRDLSML